MATASASPHLASNGRLSTDDCMPLPSFEACGQCFKLDCRKHSGKQEPRGDPEGGRPSRCVTKRATTFVMARYCPSLLRFLLTDAFQPDAVPQVDKLTLCNDDDQVNHGNTGGVTNAALGSPALTNGHYAAQ